MENDTSGMTPAAWIGENVLVLTNTHEELEGTLHGVTEYGVVIDRDTGRGGTRGPCYYSWEHVNWMYPPEWVRHDHGSLVRETERLNEETVSTRFIQAQYQEQLTLYVAAGLFGLTVFSTISDLFATAPALRGILITSIIIGGVAFGYVRVNTLISISKQRAAVRDPSNSLTLASPTPEQRGELWAFVIGVIALGVGAVAVLLSAWWWLGSWATAL
jgi:hypothetical protein